MMQTGPLKSTIESRVDVLRVDHRRVDVGEDLELVGDPDVVAVGRDAVGDHALAHLLLLERLDHPVLLAHLADPVVGLDRHAQLLQVRSGRAGAATCPSSGISSRPSASSHRGGRAGQHHHQPAARDAGARARQPRGRADLRDHDSARNSSPKPGQRPVEQRRDRLGRHVARRDAGAAGDDHRVGAAACERRAHRAPDRGDLVAHPGAGGDRVAGRARAVRAIASPLRSSRAPRVSLTVTIAHCRARAGRRRVGGRGGPRRAPSSSGPRGHLAGQRPRRDPEMRRPRAGLGDPVLGDLGQRRLPLAGRPAAAAGPPRRRAPPARRARTRRDRPARTSPPTPPGPRARDRACRSRRPRRPAERTRAREDRGADGCAAAARTENRDPPAAPGAA